jgi:hypothetical protein
MAMLPTRGIGTSPPSGGGIVPWGGTPPRWIGPEPVKGTALRPQQPQQAQPQQAQPQQTVLGAESVRATGQGPFDSAYRQNLATYGGGQFARPGGTLGFNPTAQFGQLGSLSSMGQPNGAGTAPLMGSPTDLLSMALGGQAVSAPQPTTPATSTTTSPAWKRPDWQQWLNQLQNQGGLLRGY